jgi:hypothetical protein
MSLTTYHMINNLNPLNLRVHRGPRMELSPGFLNRYPVIPADYLAFICDLRSCANQGENAWFNTVHNFNETADSAFRWNEFELMSLEAAENEQRRKVITEFWDKNLPVVLSVKGHYSHFSICLDKQRYGQVGFGNAPEFENIKPVAASFTDFMHKLATQTLDQYHLDRIR